MYSRNYPFAILCVMFSTSSLVWAKNETNCRVPPPAKVVFQESPDKTKERSLLYRARFSILKKWSDFHAVEDVTCSFTLKKNGEVLDPLILESGRSKSIDDEALNLLKQSVPLDVEGNFPDSLKVLVRFRHFPSLDLKMADVK